MAEVLPLRRLPAVSILARLGEHLPAIAALALSGILVAAGAGSVLAPWIGSAVLLLLVLRLLEPIWGWGFTHVSVGRATMTVRTGWILRRTVRAPWSALSSITARQPWAYRLLGLTVITVTVGAGDRSRIVLRGVDRGDTELIRQRAQQWRRSGEGSLAATATTGLSFRATTRQLLIASASYGAVGVWGAGAVFAMMGVVDELGFSARLLDAALAAPLASGALLLAMLVAAGLGVGWVRLHRFEFSWSADTVTVRYGLITRVERVIERAQVVGAVVSRNPAEIVFDRVSIALYSTDAAGQLGTNVLLPALPREYARELAQAMFGPSPGSRIFDSRGALSLVRAAVLGAVASLWLVGLVILAVHGTSPWRVAVCVAVGVAVALAARIALCRIAVQSGSLAVTRRFFGDLDATVRCRHVHVVRSMSRRGGRRALVSASFFSGRRRSFLAMCSREVQGRLEREVSAAAARLAIERRGRTSRTAVPQNPWEGNRAEQRSVAT